MMDLSYEDRWINLRRQIEDDIATVKESAERAEAESNLMRSAALYSQLTGLARIARYMDAADRVGAHRA